jgi:hypothetical protein
VKRTKQDSSRKPGLMEQEQWLVATTCQACKKAIDQGMGRIMVAALKFDPEADYNPSESHLSRVSVVVGISSAGERSSGKVGKLISYCNDCAQGIDEFGISNPWSLGQSAAIKPVNRSASLETPKTEMKVEAAATHKTVSVRLAHEDARAVHPGNAGTTGNSSPGEEKQRAKLLKFLNAPASQGMRPQMRQAGRHWAEGFSKGDVARKLNMDPSIVGRMINGALKMADARG